MKRSELRKRATLCLFVCFQMKKFCSGRAFAALWEVLGVFLEFSKVCGASNIQIYSRSLSDKREK